MMEKHNTLDKEAKKNLIAEKRGKIDSLVCKYIDGVDIDWFCARDYIETNNLEIPTEEECTYNGRFRFNFLAFNLFNSAIDKLIAHFRGVIEEEKLEKIEEELRSSIFCDYVDSYIVINIDKFIKKYKLGVHSEEMKRKLLKIKSLILVN